MVLLRDIVGILGLQARTISLSPQDIEAAVFTRIREAQFGSPLLPLLTPREIREAAHGLISRLAQAPGLIEQLKATKIRSLQYINALIYASLKGPSSIELSDDLRRVLVVLAQLIIGGRLFAERPSALELLGSKIKSLPHTPDIPEAAECLLNSAYLCNDPDLKIAAGRYYLEILDAEVGTALGYFISATEIDSSLVQTCDKLVEQFVETRAIFYPFGQLEPYLNEWMKHKRMVTRELSSDSAGVC